MKQKKNKDLLKLAGNVVETRGGARDGAGRKPVENKKKPITFYVRKELIESLKKAVAEWKISN